MPIEHMDMKHPKIIVAGIGPGNESDICTMKYRIIQESSDIEIEQFYYATFNLVAL